MLDCRADQILDPAGSQVCRVDVAEVGPDERLDLVGAPGDDGPAVLGYLVKNQVKCRRRSSP